MQRHRLKALLVGVLLCLAFALGMALQSVLPSARVSSAQGPVVDGRAALSDPPAPAVPVGTGARLTYQGRLTTNSGVPLNSPVSATFRLYDSGNSPIYTATRTITPTNGLFTVYLGDGTDSNLDSGVLRNAVAIGVTVGADAEMTPRQPLNSVVGYSANQIGVVGTSASGNGVEGFSPSGEGVAGASTSSAGVRGGSESGAGVFGTSAFGYGVVGATGAITAAGVLAEGASISATALLIQNGAIKVNRAGGIDSHTFAFVHQSAVGNITGTGTLTETLIDNPLTNGDRNAMLFVTHVNNPTGISSNSFIKAFGVYYDEGNQKWTIYAEDNSAFPAGITFNVMVIKR